MAQCEVVTIAEKLILFAFISCCLSSATGKISVIPKDTETATGNSVTFQCKSSTSSIEWQHLPYGQSIPEIVYQEGFIFNGYKERFRIDQTKIGEYNLVINDVRSTDSGKFTCIEKSDEADQKKAELIVFEQYPSNKSCAAKFICAPDCDALELTCSMKSYGNIIPSMEWRESANGIVASNSNSDNGITTSSIQLQPGSANARSYVCLVTYPAHSSLASQFSWSYTVFDRTVLPASVEKPPDQLDATIVIIVIVASLLAFVFGALTVVIPILSSNIKRKTTKHGNPKEFSYLVSEIKQEFCGSENNEGNLLLKQENEKDINRGLAPCTPLNKDKPIHGIGVLGDEVFLVTRDGCVVEVFDLESSKFKRAWKIDGLVNPNDMATCPTRNLIFICDWKKAAENREIFCCDKNGILNCNWISESEKGRISVTKETNVIVAESWYNTIREHTYDGRLIHKFQTGRQKLHLWHALKLENGKFVASFGDTNSEIQEICEIDKEGRTLRSVNKSTIKRSKISLSVPISLAVDGEGGIYVGDLYTGRIIFFTPELECGETFEVTDKGERLRGPLRICLHELNKQRRLLVADSVKKDGKWFDGRILSWNLTARSVSEMDYLSITI